MQTANLRVGRVEDFDVGYSDSYFQLKGPDLDYVKRIENLGPRDVFGMGAEIAGKLALKGILPSNLRIIDGELIDGRTLNLMDVSKMGSCIVSDLKWAIDEELKTIASMN